MKSRLLRIAALAALPLLLHTAVNDTIRGFDTASQAEQMRWEQQARAIPDAARVRTFIEKLSSRPHLAGTQASKENAEYILGLLREYGLDARIEAFEALLPTPGERALSMIEPVVYQAKLEEPVIDSDASTANPGMVPPFNAYSGDGDVTAPLIYVNYGVPADYDTLREQGIDVKGKIVIARYGGSWRGIKPKVAAEHGAVGCIIYSDPRDDGYYQGDVYPKGAFRPAGGVQRGSVMDMVLYPGDPLSPGWASEPGARRLRLSEAATLMKIPVLPISYADAQPLLMNLEGPVAPEAWRGALPFTYHMGSKTDAGAVKVHMKVTMQNSTLPVYNVIATIPGSELADEWVMYGNHHDAWVHGASDPLSGTAALMETARTLSETMRAGWKPRRTIKLAFWDAEEYGLVGSTEFMEKHADELSQKLAVYINGDSNSKGRISIGGSHSLEAFAQEIARDVKDPVNGKSALEDFLAKRPKDSNVPANEYRIAPLGSGSDYTPFLQHLGIAVLDIRFEGDGAGGIYHSNYDDFAWYSRFADPGFLYGKALAQVNATVVMRLANAPVLPFEFGRFGQTVNRYVDEIERLPNQKRRVDLSKVRAEAMRIVQTAKAFDVGYGRAQSKIASASSPKLAAINALLFRSERDLTLDPGLPGRPWFRHRIYAPGMYTGYAVKTLPGIREAVEMGNPDEAERQAKQVIQVLQLLDKHIAQAAKLLGRL